MQPYNVPSCRLLFVISLIFFMVLFSAMFLGFFETYNFYNEGNKCGC